MSVLQNCLIKTSPITHSSQWACPDCHCILRRFDGTKLHDLLVGFDSAYVKSSFPTTYLWQNVAWLGRCHSCKTVLLSLEMRVSCAQGLVAEKALGYFDNDDPDECDPKAYFVVSSPLVGLRWLGIRVIVEGFEAELHRFAPSPLYGLFDTDFWAWKRASLTCNWVQQVYQPFQAIPGIKDLSILLTAEGKPW